MKICHVILPRHPTPVPLLDLGAAAALPRAGGGAGQVDHELVHVPEGELAAAEEALLEDRGALVLRLLLRPRREVVVHCVFGRHVELY